MYFQFLKPILIHGSDMTAKDDQVDSIGSALALHFEIKIFEIPKKCSLFIFDNPFFSPMKSLRERLSTEPHKENFALSFGG